MKLNRRPAPAKQNENTRLNILTMKRLLTLCSILMLLVGCNKQPVTPPSPQQATSLLVLNNGNWGYNDASIAAYDFSSGLSSAEGEQFFKANGIKLGDLGQDILRCGDMLLIAVNGSKIIFVTDLNLRTICSIKAQAGDNELSPRCLCEANGKVYVSYYEGWLGEILLDDIAKIKSDDLSGSETIKPARLCKVGPNPEGLAYSDGKIYVANSGGTLWQSGYNNTVSVVDASRFAETSVYNVNCNPQSIVISPDGKSLYVSSFGNYADLAPKLEKIELSSGVCSDLAYDNVSSIAACGDLLVVACGQVTSYEPYTVEASLHKYDMSEGKDKGLFCEDIFTPYYSLSCDVSAGLVFVGTGLYSGTGDMEVYDKDGERKYSFDTAGFFPIKAIAL